MYCNVEIYYFISLLCDVLFYCKFNSLVLCSVAFFLNKNLDSMRNESCPCVSTKRESDTNYDTNRNCVECAF